MPHRAFLFGLRKNRDAETASHRSYAVDGAAPISGAPTRRFSRASAPQLQYFFRGRRQRNSNTFFGGVGGPARRVFGGFLTLRQSTASQGVATMPGPPVDCQAGVARPHSGIELHLGRRSRLRDGIKSRHFRRSRVKFVSRLWGEVRGSNLRIRARLPSRKAEAGEFWRGATIFWRRESKSRHRARWSQPAPTQKIQFYEAP